MSSLHAGSEPVRCVWPGCEELTFISTAARNEHGYATHLTATLAIIHQPNPDLFKPKQTPEPDAELPIDWGDQ